MSLSGFSELAPKLIEVTTIGDKEPKYVECWAGEGKPKRLEQNKCEYCGRYGLLYSNCESCGAQVKPAPRRAPIIPQPSPGMK